MIKKDKKGFTLIELLVVIAIIGLLSTLAVVALGNARQKARDAKRIADLKSIMTALELYNTDVGSYPNGGAAAVAYGLGKAVAPADCTTACLTISSTNGIAATAAGTTFMGVIPVDPSNPTPECTQTATVPCVASYRVPATVTTNYCISMWFEGDPDGTGPITVPAGGGPVHGGPNGIETGGCPI